MQKTPPRESTQGEVGVSADVRAVKVAQALLRCVVCAAVRFAMNAARRVPRDQGMTVSVSVAALMIDLMKRALVFMALVLDLHVVMGVALA
jgi:hypothetical protein